LQEAADEVMFDAKAERKARLGLKMR
jgi:hypothetical protein